LIKYDIWTQAAQILWQVHLPDEDDHSILQFKFEYQNFELWKFIDHCYHDS